MLDVIGWWEFALALGLLLLAVAEIVGLGLARRAGLTANRSRFVTHGLLAVASAVYAWVAVWWSQDLARTTGLAGSRFGIANWGLLLLAVILFLVLYELVAQVWAMHMGYTRSVPRLVTHVAMAIFVAVMFMMNLTRWQIYRTGLVEGSSLETAGGRMLQLVGWWELVLLAGVVLLGAAEFVALWAARRAGKTRNVSRLVVYGSLAAVAAVYSWIEVSWARGLQSAGAITVGSGHPPIAEWGLLAVAVMLFLSVYALVTFAWALRFGLVRSPARLATHLVMVAFVVLVIVINLSRWQMYFGLLEAGYQESIRPVVDAR